MFRTLLASSAPRYPVRMSSERTRLVAGCMTGTSLDGIDVALADIRGTGFDMAATFRGLVSKPLGPLAKILRQFAEGNAAPPIDYLRAARQLGELHADALCELIESHGHGVRLDFVVAHGQTIWHAPPTPTEAAATASSEANTSAATVTWGDRSTSQFQAPPLEPRQSNARANAGLSWQLFDPWPVVRRMRTPVCYDLRQADLIAGGQGAPITPLADWIMYRSTGARGIVNLGGVCNITTLAADPRQTAGRDVGPCNIVIDAVVQRLFPGQSFDRDGAIARSGQVVEMLHRAVFIDMMEIITKQRSLGRELFPLSTIDGWLAAAMKHEKPQDIVASYVAAVADVIAAAIERAAEAGGGDLVLAGGGARNPALVEAIGRHLRIPRRVILSDDVGFPCEAREAIAFAVLGALSQDGLPITLPQVTGANSPGRAGAWAYP